LTNSFAELNASLRQFYKQSKRGSAPIFNISPSPWKERGIKGVRLIENVREMEYTIFCPRASVEEVRRCQHIARLRDTGR
jgi:hypothetical protein